MNLTNDILRDETWDTTTLHSPLQPTFKEPHNRYDNNTPFGKARKLFVNVPFYWAIADGYIDDVIELQMWD